MSESLLRDMLVPVDDERVFVAAQFSQLVAMGKQPDRLRTPFPAKNLNEFYGLVKTIIDDYERRENITDDAKVVLTEEEPDYTKDSKVTITFELVERIPGAWGQGQNPVRNMVPILREEIDDPENPGYKRAIMGYIHDNIVRFTVWARTNKVANERALWFEGLMQEYSWYFVSQGVSRLLFKKRDADKKSEVNGQKLYGRPIHFFVKTETLRTISEKTFEQISVGTGLDGTGSLLDD